MRIAVITGASSGLGKEFALQIDQLQGALKPDEFWLIARRFSEMEKLARRLSRPCRIHSLDLLEEASLIELEQTLLREQPEILWLVNSAGFGKIGSMDTLDGTEQKNMLRLNCEVPLLLSKLCSPYLVRGANVLQISSVAAFVPQPHFAVYAATKSFLLSFSRALAREWKERGIRVLAVCPNPMETEFFQVAGTNEKSSGIKKIGLESPTDVAAAALKKVQYGRDLSVSSFWAKLVLLAAKVFPHRWILTWEKWLGIY